MQALYHPLLHLSLIVCLWAPASGQVQPAAVPKTPQDLEGQEPELKIKAYSKLVEVPVIVTDGAGNHVSGLTKEDFQLFEDKSEKKIATFDHVTTNRAPLGFKKLPPGTYSNLVMGAGGARVITVIVMDAVNTAFMDQAYARHQLIKYLASKVEKDSLLSLIVMTRSGAKVIHEYTTDTAVLIKALERMKARGDSPTADQVEMASSTGTDPYESAVDREAKELEQFMDNADPTYESFRRGVAIMDTIEAMDGIANSLAGIPGRKALVWATGSFPFYFDDRKGFDSSTFSPRFARLFQKLNDANIAIYPIDVRGLVTLAPSPTARLSSAQVFNPRASVGVRENAFRNTLDTLKNAAQMTGGMAYYNTNDIAGAFRKAEADSSTYYVLGYYLTGSEESKPSWRQLTVKLKRAGLKVRSRKGVFAAPVPQTKNAKREDLGVADRSPLTYTGLALVVKWPGYDEKSAAAGQEYEIRLESTQLGLTEADNEMDLDFLVVARAADGRLLDQSSHNVAGKVKKLDAFHSQPFVVGDKLKLSAPPATVRFIVRDNKTGKMGSVIVTADAVPKKT